MMLSMGTWFLLGLFVLLWYIYLVLVLNGGTVFGQ